MALTPSSMRELGSSAADFLLRSTEGKTVTRADFAGKPLLVMFICNHCPYVKHLRQHLAGLAKEYQQKGVGIVGINSNDAVNYPDDSFAKMVDEVKNIGYTFPYLQDETQQVAKTYQATCTPDFFLYDRNHKLVYRGQYDSSRPDSGKPITGADLKAALDAVLAGKPVATDQRPSIGCNIKWKS
jgi:thiol-disulfide isomerase/thioredoxin